MGRTQERIRHAVAKVSDKARRAKIQKEEGGNEPPPPPSRATKGASKLLGITRCTLSGTLFIGWLRMMGAVSFWWIAGQGYVFVLVALAEIWLDPLFRKKLLRPILSLGVMAGCIWFTLAVVFVAAPLRINAVCHSSHYPSGTELDGIKWQPYFSDLRVIVSSDSDADYEDLDIELKRT